MNCSHEELCFYPEAGDDGGDKDEGGYALIVAISELQLLVGKVHLADIQSKNKKCCYV
jgi:hypothetical protein